MLLLRDYHTRVVLLGALLLGVTAGVVGVFMTLRKRALVGDMVGHATLPGIGLAYIVMEMIEPGSGKSFDGLLRGAFLSGLAGVVCVLAIRRYSKVKEDAALAIVLGIFFGLGVALFTVIQNIPSGNAAGLNQFIFGKTHSMLAEDVTLTAKASAVTLLLCGLFFKEFALLCFDDQYAAAQGWAVLRLDMLLMLLVVTVTVIGLQSVGLLLVVALLIVPSAAARFWTDNLWRMTLLAGLLGGASSFVAVTLSALISHLPTGPLIVLVGAFFFVVSLLFGVRRGVLRRVLAHRRLRRRVGRHDLLRACFEWLEAQSKQPATLTVEGLVDRPIPPDALLAMRTWPPRRLRRLLVRARSDGLLQTDSEGHYRLTPAGAEQAIRAAPIIASGKST